MLPRDAQCKNMQIKKYASIPPKSWNFEIWLIFFHHISLWKFRGRSKSEKCQYMGIKSFLYFCTSRYNRRNPIFLFLKNSYGQKTGKNLPKSQSRGGGRNPPTKSKMFEYLLNGDEIENSIFADVLRIFFWYKNNIYTFLRLFFRNFKFFWSAFFWALRISMTYFFIFRPRDLRDGSKNQK